jgi:hypothetical protein
MAEEPVAPKKTITILLTCERCHGWKLYPPKVATPEIARHTNSDWEKRCKCPLDPEPTP